MASESSDQLHFVLIPFMSQGHLIPMIDIAKILAQRNAVVTIITTPLNAARFNATIDRAAESGLPIRLLQLQFPYAEAGLPEGCENIDSLPSPDLITNFLTATKMLQQPVEQLLEELKPSPSCLIPAKQFPWTAETALKFHVPRVSFDGTSCFSRLCFNSLHVSKVYENVLSDTDTFVVPGLPDRIELRKAQLPRAFNPGPNDKDMNVFHEKVREAEAEAYGVLVNSYEELEPAYVEGYRKATGQRVWCIGPVSLCSQEDMDKAARGNLKLSPFIRIIKLIYFYMSIYERDENSHPFH
jgi:hypothetical protein